jgi:hypothetical protein
MSLDDSKFFQLVGIIMAGFGIFVLISYTVLSWKFESSWILTDNLWRIFILGVIIECTGLMSVGIGAILSRLKTLSS